MPTLNNEEINAAIKSGRKITDADGKRLRPIRPKSTEKPEVPEVPKKTEAPDKTMLAIEKINAKNQAILGGVLDAVLKMNGKEVKVEVKMPEGNTSAPVKRLKVEKITRDGMGRMATCEIEVVR